MNWKKTLLICLLILAVAAAGIYLIFSTEPTAQREGATKETAMLVETITVERGTFQPVIEATGTVQPEQDVILSPRVQGMIVSLSSNFIPGGTVRKGEVLLRLDPADYENMVRMRQSELDQALADLSIEQGRQNVALQDYELVGRELPEEKKALALRQPQLNAIQARIAAAEAAVEQAELLLERTTIRAPFNAQVVTRDANVGSQVAPGDQLARLVGLDRYWIVATVPMNQLRWLDFPAGSRTRGAAVRIRDRSSWPAGQYREGYVEKLLGTLDDQTRLARVLVTVTDPLARRTNTADYPLMIGAFVQTHIQAREIENVVRLDRDYLRQNETVWVMEDGKLRIRDAGIAFRDAEYAYLESGLAAGDSVVTTNLATVVDGAPLRLEQTGPAETPDTMASTIKD